VVLDIAVPQFLVEPKGFRLSTPHRGLVARVGAFALVGLD
jgi:hypothetical protein